MSVDGENYSLALKSLVVNEEILRLVCSTSIPLVLVGLFPGCSQCFVEFFRLSSLTLLVC